MRKQLHHSIKQMDPLTKEQIKEKKYLIDKLLKVKKNVKENEYDYNK